MRGKNLKYKLVMRHEMYLIYGFILNNWLYIFDRGEI